MLVTVYRCAYWVICGPIVNGEKLGGTQNVKTAAAAAAQYVQVTLYGSSKAKPISENVQTSTITDIPLSGVRRSVWVVMRLVGCILVLHYILLPVLVVSLKPDRVYPFWNIGVERAGHPAVHIVRHIVF